MTENHTTKAGWQRVRFGNVVRQVKDKVDPQTAGLERYVAGEHMDTDDLRIRRWGTIGDGYLGPAFHMRFRPGQILYGSRRTYLRKVAVPDFDGICANTTYVLETKDPSVMLPGFLPFVMQTEKFHEHSIKQSKGSVNPYINFSDLEWFEFDLPPMEEQRKLVKLFLAHHAVISNLSNVLDQSQKFYIAALISFFESGEKGGKGWTLRRVDELFGLQLGKMSSEASRTKTDQYSYLKNNNIRWGSFDFGDLSQMNFSEDEQRKFSLFPGDLLVCEGGEIGRAAVWKNQYPGLFYQKALHRLRPLTANVSSEFMMHYLRYCSIKGILKSIATGTTIMHLPAERLATLRLYFPSHQEQMGILAVLESIHSENKLIDQRVANTKTIFKNFIEGLFTS